jgi:hypothetical protein
MAWANVDGNIVDLDEVVLLSQRIGQEERVAPVPGEADKPDHPLLVTVHLRGGSSFTLGGRLAVDFMKFFIAHVATDMVSWDPGLAPGSVV